MVQHHAWVYNCAWHSIPNLGTDNTLLSQYKVLERQDLKINTAVIAPNVRGQRNKSLPWFWSMDIQRDADVGAWMSDCRCTLVYVCSDTCSTKNQITVYRVHWLRAKAQKMQWIEELQSLQVEMESAVRFFQHQEQFWQKKQELIEHQLQPGHAAWAARQSAMWHLMAMQMGFRFDELLKSQLPPDFAKVIQPHSQ